VEELLYLRGLTNEDIVAHLERLNVPKSATIYADSAEPKSIESLRRLGYRNTIPAQKGPDSVRAGINRIKGYIINVNPTSQNFIEEYYNYAYRTGTDKPIDSYNHLMDAFRYAMTGFKQEGSMYAVMGRPKQGVEIL
jgi:phage terminase large subunit